MTRIRIIIRSLFKNKVTSIITITGFSISISMALVIIAFIIGEFSYDKDYPNINRVYRVFANDNRASVREDFREFFLEEYPAIEDACRYNNYGTTLTFDNKPFTGQMIVTDTSFFNIFSTQFLIGSIGTSLINLNDIVLTESFARKIFGDADPVGKTFIAEYQTPLTVSGVVKDFNSYSSIRGDFFTNSKIKIKYEGWSDGMGNEVNYFRLFILVRSAGNISGLEELMNTDIKSIQFKAGYKIEKINLIPFASSYFTQGIDKSQTFHANLKLIKLFSLISLIIILLAVFNYINLTTANHSDRFREIGIKKTVGAGRQQIFMQFILEAFFVCFISLLCALLLSSFLVPFFEKFLGNKIDLNILFRPFWLIWLLIGVLVVSFLSGVYPALSISRLRPLTILMKQKAARHRSFSLRALLNIFQNAVSVTLIIALIVLSKQIDYVRTKNYGFDTDQLLRVDVHWRLSEKAGIIRDKLLSDPLVKNVCFSHGSPGSIYTYSSWAMPGKPENTMYELTTDTAFLKVFRIPLISGRELLPSDLNKVCYINETAFKTAGWDTYEGEKYHGFEIIGVVKDFHFADLYTPINPMAIIISSEWGISHLTLRVTPENIPGTIDLLTKTWREVCPGHELSYQFYDEWLDSMYKSEEKLAAAIRLFAILAIMISCLGIIGLAEFSIRKRIKEIGIRKVNGARVSEVMILLNKDFFKWIVIAFIIAIPVAGYTMNKWLESFAYKTNLSWWIFAEAGLIILGITLLTVSLQSWRAATNNPVEALRYE
ncbi:MAG: ABC transporter permease [Bacteroidia bacterium]|nr:ABC transporter permease [Bacteroidia bacterium]